MKDGAENRRQLDTAQRAGHEDKINIGADVLQCKRHERKINVSAYEVVMYLVLCFWR